MPRGLVALGKRAVQNAYGREAIAAGANAVASVAAVAAVAAVAGRSNAVTYLPATAAAVTATASADTALVPRRRRHRPGRGW